jgi:hypothetical protein
VGTAQTLGPFPEVSQNIAGSAERSRNVERAYAIFRVSLGFDIFMHGFSRILTGVAAFVALTEKPFVKTIIPMPVVHYFLTILPYLEFAIGALLIAGLFTMEVSHRWRSGHDHLDHWDGRQTGMGERWQRNDLCSLVFPSDRIERKQLALCRQSPKEVDLIELGETRSCQRRAFHSPASAAVPIQLRTQSDDSAGLKR